MSELRKLQVEEFKILQNVVSICNKYKLRYYLIGGTLLGAIRHKGFIPWDDDIDVAMPREDYERFKKIALKEICAPYKIRSYENDKEYRYAFARVVNSSMKVINKSANIPRKEEVWIDLIPLDAMPDSKIIRAFHKIHLQLWWGINQIVQFDEMVDQKRKRGKLSSIIVKFAGMFKNLSKITDYKICLSKLNRVLMKYPYDSQTKDVVNYLAAFGFKEIFPRNCFGDGVMCEFEGQMFNCPQNYDCVCRIIYGDYMTLPPEEDRNRHNLQLIE